MLVAQLCLTSCSPLDCSLQAPLFMEFSRQEYWSGLPFPSPRDLPDPGIKPSCIYEAHKLRVITCICVYIYIHANLLQLCLTQWDSVDCSPPCSSVHGDFPGKNTEVGFHALLQGIFLTQGLNPHLLCVLDWQADSSPLVPPGKPIYTHTYL